MKISIHLSIDKSIKFGKSDFINITCIDQSVEIDDTVVSFIDLSRFLPISSIYIGRFFCTSEISSSLEFVEEMTIDFMQIVRFSDQRVEKITFTFLFVLMITVNLY